MIRRHELHPDKLERRQKEAQLVMKNCLDKLYSKNDSLQIPESRPKISKKSIYDVTPEKKEIEINPTPKVENLSQSKDLEIVKEYNHRIAKSIMNKQPRQRSKEELTTLFYMIRGMNAFQKTSDFMLKELCSVMQGLEMDNNRSVFKQGDTGTCWYVIFKGSVQIYKSFNNGNSASDRVPIAQLQAGEGFGDLALLNDAPRAATIVTLEPCFFAKVEKEDFTRLIGFVHRFENLEKQKIMSHIPFFSDDNWKEAQRKTLASISRVKMLPAQTTIIQQDEEIKDVCFLAEGTCDVYIDFYPSPNQKSQIHIGILKPGDYWNESCAIKEETKSRVTIKSREKIKYLSFSGFDARMILRNLLNLTKPSRRALDNEYIERKYKEKILAEKWQQFRSEVLAFSLQKIQKNKK